MALKRGNDSHLELSSQHKISQAHQWARQVVDRQHAVASPFHQNLVQIMQSADSWFGSFARVFQFALRRQVAVNSINQPSNHGKPLHGMWCSPQFSDKLKWEPITFTDPLHSIRVTPGVLIIRKMELKPRTAWSEIPLVISSKPTSITEIPMSFLVNSAFSFS